jgi:hypothetical protein
MPKAPRRTYLPEPTLAAYRTAMQQARNGNRKTLLGLYEQAVQDAHLISVMQQRTLATLSRPYALSGIEGKALDDAKLALAGSWFMEFLRLAMRSIFYGAGLVQLGPPKPIGGFEGAIGVPETLLLPETEEVEVDGSKRLRYTDAPYVDWAIPLGKAAEPGLLARAVPLVLAKQQALGGWNKYLEVFGMPFRKAHTDLRDPEQLSRMADMLANMGSAGWGVFDHDDRVEFVQTGTASHNQQGYESLCRFADEQLSKLILGQTMTTDKGGSLAQAQVHERTAQALFRADALWLEDVVNSVLLPRMVRLGMPVAGVHFAFLPDENALPPEVKLDLVKTLLPHYRIPIPWLKAEFGIALDEERPATP